MGRVVGGGIFAKDSVVLLNNIIAFSTDGVGIHVEEGSPVTADYNLVFGNDGGEYGGDAVAGPNDLNVDPLLDADELHLTDASPCVDAGDPDLEPLADETDIDGEVVAAAGADGLSSGRENRPAFGSEWSPIDDQMKQRV